MMAYTQSYLILRSQLYSELQNMNSKKVLITGGTKGLGRSLADLFIGNKYEVFLTTRNGLTSSEGNKRFKILKLNLAEIESVSSFGDKFIENYGVPDVLINNAGYGAFFEWGNFDTTQTNIC